LDSGNFGLEVHAPAGQQQILVIPFNHKNIPSEPTEIPIKVVR
jgi:hypothetical protein